MKNKQHHMSGPDRKQQLLTAALELSAVNGLHGVTREDVAAQAGCASGLVTRYFRSMPLLRHAIVVEAVRVRDLYVIAQALAIKHPAAALAPRSLRRAALDSLL